MASQNSPETFKKEVETNVFKKDTALSTRVESWILEEGQKLPEPINFGLWSTNIQTAEKDLKKIFANPAFADLKTSCDFYLKNKDPDKKSEFIKVFAEKLQGQVKIRQEGKIERAKVSEKVGKDLLTDTLKNGFKKIDQWKEEGTAGYVKMAGTGLLLYFVVFKGVKAVWKGLKGIMAGDSAIKSLATGGLLLGGGALLLKKTLMPKSALTTETEPAEKPEEFTEEQEHIEKIVENSEDAKALMGLLQTPVKDVLKAYNNSRDNQINPKFLLSHIKGVRGFDKKWTRRMIKKISPTKLYETIHSTVSLFQNSEGYKKELQKADPIGLPEYIYREYVKKAEDTGTTIEFPELLADALEVANEKQS